MFDDFKMIFLPVLIIIASILVMVFGLIATFNHFFLPAEIADIEQLREDAFRVNIQESEDIKGQVVEVNRQIQRNRAYNNMFIIGLAIPDKWEEIELIEIN
jgi:hypothetical protein